MTPSPGARVVAGRHQGEIPVDFAERFGGESKASLVQGFRFLMQLAMLRFGRLFSAIASERSDAVEPERLAS
ncbi:hypothetical protein ELQ92_06770 [Labedella populi]|uniref:Uncharacterized protein n=1 Tax=Labedella populi TaxID=2498850 RepID=A0A444QCS3_9MICO|nr:hypothetical protein [Labedella populi]RWZ64461.1 hypothetical protein ELQ92_06770 [Labedella populi]